MLDDKSTAAAFRIVMFDESAAELLRRIVKLDETSIDEDLCSVKDEEKSWKADV
jgi:hypothetical protein